MEKPEHYWAKSNKTFRKVERQAVFMDKKTQYCNKLKLTQIYLYIECYPNPNPNRLVCVFGGRDWQVDPNMYTENKRIKNTQNSLKKKEQNWNSQNWI